MVKVPPVSSPWIPEDDLLLKNSIEAGASLEALAKGAVKFSRRFTYSELRDRWHSLLYDPDNSAQASSRMVELELSGSVPSLKFSRSYNSKGSENVPEKRKGGSIRGLYYAMRKKLRSEFYGSPDIGFLNQPNLPNCNDHGHAFQEQVPLNNEDHRGDSMVGDCLANNLGLHETDLEILLQAFPVPTGDISTTSDADDNAGNGFHTQLHNTVEDDNPNRILRKVEYGFSKDVSPFIRNGIRSSLQMKMEPQDGTHTLDGESNGFGKCIGIPGTGTSQTNESPSKQVSNYDRLPLWRTMEDVSAPAMPVNENNEELPQGTVEILRLPDDNDCIRETTPGYDAPRSASLLIERPDASDFVNPHAVSEGEFTDLPDSLLNFSNEDDGLLFMDVDGKDTMDKSCYDALNSLLLGSSKEVLDADLCEVVHKASSVVPCPEQSEDIAPPVHVNQQSDPQVEVDVPLTSVLNSEPLQFREGKIICVLNTEDPEIPCNDDIFLLIHPGTTFGPSSRQPVKTDSIDPTFSFADQKDGAHRFKLMNKGKDPPSSFTRPQKVGKSHLPESVSGRPLVGCATKPELLETKSVVLHPALPNKSTRDPYQSRSGHVAPLTIVAGVLEEDLTKVESRVVDNPAISSERPLHDTWPVKLTIPESIANPSTSDQDECESDGDVPYYSDLEAMILDMDLAYEQDSCISKQVARYQYEDTKRTIIRLEQTAHASMQRAMTSKGAFAILYGRRLKHYIQKTEVTLGRSTEDTDIDIDLRREGRAHKISRRQAIIKIKTDGSFSLKNLGKNIISVNGKAVGNGQEFALSSSCLIEIKGMSFVFEINEKYVRRYLDNLTKQSQVKSSNLKWSLEEEE